MKQENYKDVTVTSRGQLTLPASMRRAMKLGSKRKVRLSMKNSGELSLQALPDVMSYFGKLKTNVPYDPREKRKARGAMGGKRIERN